MTNWLDSDTDMLEPSDVADNRDVGVETNVFSSLLAPFVGPGENALTETLVFVLRFLLRREPTAGKRLLGQLCDLREQLEAHAPEDISIRTQVATEMGRPDIEIAMGKDVLVYVEVKQDALPSDGQLEFYQKQLQRSGVPCTRLVLLSRSRITAFQSRLPKSEYHHVCWYQVHRWLSAAEAQDPVSQYFSASFVELLRQKRMSMDRVSSEYVEGVPALMSLMNMLQAALEEVLPADRIRLAVGRSWYGFRIPWGCWLGIWYHTPTLVVLADNFGNEPNLFKRDLDLKGIGFFRLSKDEQFERLAEWVRKGIAEAETPHEPARSE